jgi:thiamine pyrophosphokinase
VHAVVIAGGDPPTADQLAAIPPDALLVAADSGIGPLHRAGLVPDALIGDLDSADPVHVAIARERGVRIEVHPPDKDATDLELALGFARDEGATHVTVLGLGGGRVDHFLANILLLAHDEWAALAIDAHTADSAVTVVRGQRSLSGIPGDMVTLLAVNGPAAGVTTVGLRWTLTDAVLTPASTRGVSNEIVTAPATVTVRDGVIVAVEPHGGS